MKVVFVEEYIDGDEFHPQGEIVEVVDSCSKYGLVYFLVIDGMDTRSAYSRRFRPATPEDISPKLWQSHKDILNEEALSALEQVIMGEHSEDLNFSDCECLDMAFAWSETPQGCAFWKAVNEGWYNKQEEPAVTKFDFTNTKINIKKYADESGITIEQAVSDIKELCGKKIHPGVIQSSVHFIYWHPGEYFGYDTYEGHNFFLGDSRKEITLTRNITITPSFVTPETVSLPDGRTVLKKDYDEALSKLKTFSGN